jgi:hypothetical protein
MMFSIPDKPKVCPVCGSEPSSLMLDNGEEALFRCGADWRKDTLIGSDLCGYVGWIPYKQCGWATPICLELLAGKLYDPQVPRFMQVDL